MTAILELKSLTKGYPDTPVLNGINLTVSEGEFIAILGFSGTGKTTLISLIAGLQEPDGGEVAIRGKAVNGPGSETSLVFQSYSLFPWLTVEGNVALAVDAVQRARQFIGAAGVVGQQAFDAQRHVAQTASGVDAWAQCKAEIKAGGDW